MEKCGEKSETAERGGRRVLVGTYRPENAAWIREKRLYNLPIAATGDAADIAADVQSADGRGASHPSSDIASQCSLRSGDMMRPHDLEAALNKFSSIVLYSEDRPSMAFAATFREVVDGAWLKANGYAVAKRPHGVRYALFALGERLSAAKVLSDPKAEVWVASSRWTGKIDADFYSKPLPACGGASVPNIFEKLRPYFRKWQSARAFNPVQGEFFSWNDLMTMKMPKRNEFTAVELFAGAGGLSLGLERAGIHVVIANEIMHDFAATLAANHPDTNVINEDIHKIDFKAELKKLGLDSVDVLSGGPPCQGFSTIGSKNRQDPRNSLFYEYLRAVAETNPKYTIFENVSGFKRMYGGFAYETLVRELGELGYETACEILNAADYGAPQIRYRTVVLGWKRGLPAIEFPKPTNGNGEGLRPYLSLMEAIGDLPPLAAGESVEAYSLPPQNDYQRRMRGQQKALLEHNAANYGEKMQEILRIIPAGGSIKDLPPRLRPKSAYCNTYARLLPDEPSPTVTRNFGTPSSSRCVHPFQPRALSTREGARLQGFPDGYKFVGGKQSKNLQIGNAVPPILGEAIARVVVKALKEKEV